MIEPIVDEASYKRALARIEALFDVEDGTPEAAELDALATLVEAYERKHYPIPPPDPIEAILARLDDLRWTRKDLEPLIGSRARVSEVLSGRRALTLPMIRKIHAAMSIPLEVLIGPGPGVRKAKPKLKNPPTRAERAERTAKLTRKASDVFRKPSKLAIPSVDPPSPARTAARSSRGRSG